MPEHFEVPLTTQPVMTHINTRSILDIDPGLSRTMGAAFDDAMTHNPVQSVNRMIRQSIYGKYTGGHTGIGRDLEIVEPQVQHPGLARMQKEANAAAESFFESMSDNDNWLSPAFVKEKIEANGFTSADIPTSRGGANIFALDNVILGKIAERNRGQILQRGSKGRMIPVFAAGLAASVLDPINLAASFIPVVGQARYLALLKATKSTAGRFGVRAGIGAVEGAAGAILVEPLSLAAASQDLLHYGIEDSMMNVLFGTIMGGGMHTGIGYIGDKIRLRNGLGLDPEPRGLTAEALDGVDPVLRQKAMESAIAAAVRDRGLVVDELIEGIHGPLNVGEKFELPQSVKFDIDDSGRIIPRDPVDIAEVIEEILQNADTPTAIRRIIKAADTPEEAIQTMSRLLERQKDMVRKNVDDIKNILGTGATKEDVKTFSDVLQAQFKHFDNEITEIASNQTAATDFDLKNYSDIFEAPENLNSFDRARLTEVNEIRERVPTNADDAFVETQIKDSEAIVKEFEEATGIEDATFRKEKAQIRKQRQEFGRMTKNLVNCIMRGT